MFQLLVLLFIIKLYARFKINNKFKIWVPAWNENFDLPDGSYSIADVQDYFKFIIKKYETLSENSSVQIYPNKIKNRIILKIKNGCKLELLTHETMKLLGSTKKVVNKEKNGENVPEIESFEVILIHYNLVKNEINIPRRYYLLLYEIKNLVN